MKLKKKLFDRLQNEMMEAKDKEMMAQCAINALQELCDHKWKHDVTHGYPGDDTVCEICGKEKIAEN